MNTLFTIGGVDGDGIPDLVVGGRDGRMVWIQNTGESLPWPVHLVDEVQASECGGFLWRHSLLPGPHLINGGDWRGKSIHWWENPGLPGEPWTKRTVLSTAFGQFHDLMMGDVTGTGDSHLIFTNQQQGGMGIVPVPDEPTQEPWPGVRMLAEGMKEDGIAEEGLALMDVNGDGVQEIVFGTHWYSAVTGERHRICGGYVTTVLAVADIDGDGKHELLVSEGDPVIFGRTQGARFSWFKPRHDPTEQWEEHQVAEGLLDAHTLQTGEFCGSDLPDLVVGEIGDAKRLAEAPPRLLLYENLGAGQFQEHVIDVGTGTHRGRLADFRGTGRLDFASRPLHGPEKWDVFVWFNEG
jgi:hypothetical protein